MVAEYVINWFKERCGEDSDIEMHLEDNYITIELIDSFGFLDLISNCEEKFGISFSDDDFATDDIFTIKGLISLISKQIGE